MKNLFYIFFILGVDILLAYANISMLAIANPNDIHSHKKSPT